MSICVTEVVGIVEQEHAQAAGISLAPSLDDEVVRRRDYLAGIYESLPGYGSNAFWRIVEEPDQRLARGGILEKNPMRASRFSRAL